MGGFGPTFARFFLWSLETLIFPGLVIVTIALAINLLASLACSLKFHRERWCFGYSRVFLQFLFFPGLIVLAAVFAAGPYDPALTVWRDTLALCTIGGMGTAALLVGLRCVRLLKGFQWLAVSVLLLQLWMLYCASWIAGMAISGDWI